MTYVMILKNRINSQISICKINILNLVCEIKTVDINQQYKILIY